MTGTFDKEAYVGVAGRTCWYRGHAVQGLEIQLADEDVLKISGNQVREIFAALGAHNPLDEECRGFANQARSGPLVLPKFFGRPSRGLVRGAYAKVVSPRFWRWLQAHSRAAFGRTLTEEHAACIQGVFGGEGLLEITSAKPEDFPVADLATATQALLRRTVIYEEGRWFAALKVADIAFDVDRDYLTLGLENLGFPGLSEDFPKQFSVGGETSQMRLDAGLLASGAGIWLIVTGSGTVRELLRIAASGVDRRAFLKAHRRLVYGYGLTPSSY